MKKTKQTTDPKRDFLRLAHERFKLAMEAEAQTRRDSLDDLEFSVGKQWPADIETQRNLDGRPCLTMNRLPQFIRQVTNEQRQQRPAIQVNPVGDGADVDTAEIEQGIIRHIEINSDAEIAYDTAFDQAVRTGLGYFRVLTEYVDGDTLDQEIKIKRIKNPFTVYFDPACVEPDYSDARWAFIIEDIPRADYVQQFPDSAVASLTDYASVGDQAPGWASKETVRIAEYFHVDESTRTLLKLEDGSLIEHDKLPEGANAVSRTEKPERKVMWAKITALDILDETEWRGKWIPIIPVLGDDINVNGRRFLAGLVRSAKDPQRAYNYWISAATEMIALAPKAPFIGAEGQFENHEEQWRLANQRNFPYLQYKPTSVAGQPLPAPQRQAVEPPIQAMAIMIRQADNDLKATTGIYDASLGEKGPDQSGRAILARQKQTDISILNFSDNLARSIRHTGRLLLDLIPKIYDTPRIQRIVAPDQTVSHVITHKGADQRQAAQALLTDKIQKIYDLGVGRYDVTVSVGPSYQSKRQEAVASQMELIRFYPQAMQIAGDLLVRNMDWPGAAEIADRLKKLLPPQLQDDGDTDPEAQLQRAQAQLQALAQQHDLLVKALSETTEAMKMKKLDLESRERIAIIQAQAAMVSAELKTRGEGALELMRAQFEALNQRLTLLHEAMSLDSEMGQLPGGSGAQLPASSPPGQPMSAAPVSPNGSEGGA